MTYEEANVGQNSSCVLKIFWREVGLRCTKLRFSKSSCGSGVGRSVICPDIEGAILRFFDLCSVPVDKA